MQRHRIGLDFWSTAYPRPVAEREVSPPRTAWTPSSLDGLLLLMILAVQGPKSSHRTEKESIEMIEIPDLARRQRLFESMPRSPAM